MKKIIFILLFANCVYSQEYKYCELVGMQKGLFSRKIVVGIDDGSGMDWDALTDTITVKSTQSAKNVKMYITTTESTYEGKTVQSDANGKYIWKPEIIKPSSEPTKTKRKVFNSMIDGMNFMGADGWEFVQAFTVTEANQNVYHYVLKKKK